MAETKPNRATSEDRLDDCDSYGEDAMSMVAVSIGREQTRLTSPTTPAAELSAALDRTRNWAYFDELVDEDPSVDRQEDQDLVRNTIRNAQPPSPDAETTNPPELSPPSRLHVAGEDGDGTRTRTRSKTGSAVTMALADLNIKRFLSSFSTPSLGDVLHKLAGFIEDGPSSAKLGRSNSLFSHVLAASSKDAFPEKETNGTLGGEKTAGHAVRTVEDVPAGGGPEGNEQLFDGSLEHERQSGSRTPIPSANLRNVSQPASPNRRPMLGDGPNDFAPQLRKAASDFSLARVSSITSLGDDSRFDDTERPVNSRFRAVRDSWQDSIFKLPRVPSINFSALRPDFTKRASDTDQRALKSTDLVSGRGRPSAPNVRGSDAPAGFNSSRLPRRNLEDSLDRLTGDVLLMGGYRGSILRSAEAPNRQLWVPVKVGLNIRRVNLEVGLDPEDEETEESRIFASGMLSHIGPIDMSRRLIKRMRNCRNAKEGKLRVHDYGYDWRLSPELLSRRLIAFLQKLPSNRSNVPPSRRGTTVIAHSLGGLITRHAMNQRPELFAGIVFAGTPQHCVNILGPLRNGDDVLLSARVLTAQVNFTFRTSFALLPESGQCFIDRDTKEEYPVDFFDPAAWKENCLSPCIAPCLPTRPQPERKNSILTTISSTLDSLASRTSGGASPSPPLPAPTSPTPRTVADATATTASELAHPADHTVNISAMPPGGAAAAQSSTIPPAQATAYLERTLASALRFKRALRHDPGLQAADAYPPLAVLYATSTPTVYGARVSGRDGIRRADAYDALAFASGDGVVLARAAMLPPGYRCAAAGRVRTDRGHVGLLGDLEAVGRCLAAVVGAREMGVGLGRCVEVVS